MLSIQHNESRCNMNVVKYNFGYGVCQSRKCNVYIYTFNHKRETTPKRLWKDWSMVRLFLRRFNICLLLIITVWLVFGAKLAVFPSEERETGYNNKGYKLLLSVNIISCPVKKLYRIPSENSGDNQLRHCDQSKYIVPAPTTNKQSNKTQQNNKTNKNTPQNNNQNKTTTKNNNSEQKQNNNKTKQKH